MWLVISNLLIFTYCSMFLRLRPLIQIYSSYEGVVLLHTTYHSCSWRIHSHLSALWVIYSRDVTSPASRELSAYLYSFYFTKSKYCYCLCSHCWRLSTLNLIHNLLNPNSIFQLLFRTKDAIQVPHRLYFSTLRCFGYYIICYFNSVLKDLQPFTGRNYCLGAIKAEGFLYTWYGF